MVRIQIQILTVVFLISKMSDQATPSRNRKRERFLFDDVENSVISEEDDNILVGASLRGQLIYSDNFATATKQDIINDRDEDEAELVTTTASIAASSPREL